MIKYFEGLDKEDAGIIIFQKGFKTPGGLKLRFPESVSSVSPSLEEGILGVPLRKLFVLWLYRMSKVRQYLE